MAGPDRLASLLAAKVVTAIDFVNVHPDHETVDVYFIVSPDDLVPAFGPVSSDDVVVTDGDTGLQLAVDVVGLVLVGGRRVLRFTAPGKGRFALQQLVLDHPSLDPWLNTTQFSFAATCPSDLDCADVPVPCPEDEVDPPPVDYLARDFWSLRRALLDMASLRYPDWQDRTDADVGIMLTELFSAQGDDFAYQQDQAAREGTLETAMLRRSVRLHARMVDYELDDGEGSRVWLDVTVGAGLSGSIPVETDVRDREGQTVFEVGGALGSTIPGYLVDSVRNELAPHIWDAAATCLATGSTHIDVIGHVAASLPWDDFPPDQPPGKWVLVRTDPTDLAVPSRRWAVRVVSKVEGHDPVLGVDYTRLTWEPAQATPWQLDLTVLVVRANLVPATAGTTRVIEARVESDPPAPVPGLVATVERAGPGGVTIHRISLPETADHPLVHLRDERGVVRPQVRVRQLRFDGVDWVPDVDWDVQRSLLGFPSSKGVDRHVTLEDGQWGRIAAHQRATDDLEQIDLQTGAGTTVRFGDGVFGLAPARGTRFRVTYRTGNGRLDDRAADTVQSFSPSLPFVDAVTNPVAAQGGRDPQSLDVARIEAPEAFRSVAYRAVRVDDYAEAIERLDWVQRAGASMRWTGSWPTVFAAPDPVGVTVVSPEQELLADAQLDRFRQAGREAYVRPPRYADVDLDICVCAEPSSYRGDVEAAVRLRLCGTRSRAAGWSRPGAYFSPDEFTFGTPLRRAALEAAIQAVPGVRAVEQISIRRRGRFDWRPFDELIYEVALDEVLRIADDLDHPEWGTVRLVVEGGA